MAIAQLQALLLLFLCIHHSSSQGTSEKAQNQILSLYKILSEITGIGGAERFTMLLPGKILNFDDYYPGDEYVNSLNSDDPEARRIEIPKRVMENMFSLADTVPPINPFAGGDAGISLAATYRTLLSQMTVRGIDSLSTDKRKAHAQAIEYLSETVIDPMDKTIETNRLYLYKKYNDLYNKMKVENEKAIEERRASLPAADYEEWFTQNYPVYQARLDGAYLEWLVFGHKDEVETKWLQLDSASPGIELLEAKSALRASGVSSLDRTQTVYPVYFTPSNWYIYINETVKPMSREQVQNRIGELEGQRLLLLTTRSISVRDVCFDTLNDSKTSAESQSVELDAELTAAVELLTEKRCKCIAAANENPTVQRANITECMEYDKCVVDVQALAERKGSAITDASELQDILSTNTDNRGTDAILYALDDEISELRSLLPTAPSSSLAASLVDNTVSDPNDRWLSFEYNSQSSSIEQIQSSSYSVYSSYSSSYTSSNSYNWWSNSDRSYSSSYSARSSTLDSLTNSSIVVKGKILKVSIQRPWFRPDIFKNTRIGFTDPDLRVSPGIPGSTGDLTESQFLATASSYRLPQYMTGFLLARDVELEFNGVDKSTTSSVFRASRYGSRSSSSTGWGCFGFSGRSDYSGGASGRGQAGFQASTVTSGLKISVPGVQVIGYFAQVVDQFPAPA